VKDYDNFTLRIVHSFPSFLNYLFSFCVGYIYFNHTLFSRGFPPPTSQYEMIGPNALPRLPPSLPFSGIIVSSPPTIRCEALSGNLTCLFPFFPPSGIQGSLFPLLELRYCCPSVPSSPMIPDRSLSLFATFLLLSVVSRKTTSPWLLPSASIQVQVGRRTVVAPPLFNQPTICRFFSDSRSPLLRLSN